MLPIQRMNGARVSERSAVVYENVRPPTMQANRQPPTHFRHSPTHSRWAGKAFRGSSSWKHVAISMLTGKRESRFNKASFVLQTQLSCFLSLSAFRQVAHDIWHSSTFGKQPKKRMSSFADLFTSAARTQLFPMAGGEWYLLRAPTYAILDCLRLDQSLGKAIEVKYNLGCNLFSLKQLLNAHVTHNTWIYTIKWYDTARGSWSMYANAVHIECVDTSITVLGKFINSIRIIHHR